MALSGLESTMEQLQAITDHFDARILPLCIQFTNVPPADSKQRAFEHKRLSEMVMNEVLLKLDTLEIGGDLAGREKKRALVRKTQAALKGLDSANSVRNDNVAHGFDKTMQAVKDDNEGKQRIPPPPVRKPKPAAFRTTTAQQVGKIDGCIDRSGPSSHQPSIPSMATRYSEPLPTQGSHQLGHLQPPMESTVSVSVQPFSETKMIGLARPITSIAVGESNSIRLGGNAVLPKTISEISSLSDYFVANYAGKVYTDQDFQRISDLLRETGRGPWSKVPRIYTVLRIINQLQVIDAFIDQGISDIWFPFSTSSLPKALGSALHPQFLEAQKGVLTKGLDLERDEGRKHAHFGRDETLPFKVDKELGGGRFSQVHKVTSTITKREFARKQFRRGAGLRNAAEIKSFKVELQVLKKIHHHHCVELVSGPHFYNSNPDVITGRKLH
jgi:hypothetical protein